MIINPSQLHPVKDRGLVYLEAFGIVSILLILVCLHLLFTTGIGMPNWRALKAHSTHTDELAAGFTHFEKPVCEPISGARGRTRRSKESSTSVKSARTTAPYMAGVPTITLQKQEDYDP